MLKAKSQEQPEYLLDWVQILNKDMAERGQSIITKHKKNRSDACLSLWNRDLDL